jgi:pimeloyl-ACP methyl ester carboxylesterase
MTETRTQQICTSALDICYEESGVADHCPVILLHGFPDDVRAYDCVVPELIKHGYRAIVPYLRGYGKTRFLNSTTMRSGQQAALGRDLLELMDNLKIDKAILVGYDWGGRAACIVSALWPDRVIGLVSIGGYNIQNISRSTNPAIPEQESLFWYMWYFNTERGRLGLELNRRELCHLLWQRWCPNWRFTDDEYERTAVSFDNPDFVEVIIHSYRHRLGNSKGDPSFEAIENKLLNQPLIQVPTIDMDGACDGLDVPGTVLPDDSNFFSGPYERRIIPVAGHFLPRESASAVVQAVLDLKTLNRHS